MEKYYCQLVAKTLKKMMCTPQDDFHIDDNFLCGLDKESFINGYKEAFSLFKCIYEDIYNNPELFGCTLLDISVYDKFDPKVISMKITSIFDFIYALMESGKIENGFCIISVDTFLVLKKFFNITKLSLFYDRLNEYGFSFQGWNGRSKLESTATFTLEYSDNPYLLTVLKAGSEKARKIKENKATKILDDHFYTMSYHLFSDNSETLPPYSQDDYKKFLDEEQYAFVQAFNDFMESKGMKTEWSGLLRINYLKSNGKEHPECFICYTNYKYGLHNDNKLLLRYRFHNVSRYQYIIEKAPEHIKNVFINNIDCGHCHSNGVMDLSKHCDYRVCYVLDNKQYAACIWKGFYFTDLRLNDIEYYKQFYEHEYSKK